MTMQRTRPDAPNPTGAQRWIERVEQARDLKRNMMEALGPEENNEFEFYEWSPGRTYVTLWSMEDGTEVELPRYIAEQAINLIGPTGEHRFTAFKEKAPAPRENNVKCFLHPDSPERPLLEELGIQGYCPANTLANETAKWQHADSRHSRQLTQYRTEMNRREEAQYRQEQREQMEIQRQQAAAFVEFAKAQAEGPKRRTRDGE